ncbi:peptidylprolyl isomerase [Neobacillus sp. SM06]|uniref:peptidylprolyl isomerase n=1 Tax=Neobacillus sp. SM06 TaxID=3422492 RepID=UPI003D2D44CA
MKKWMLALALASGVLALSACSQNGSEKVAESKVGDVTKDELYNAMKEKIGTQALQQLVYEKVLAKKYPVTDKEVNQKVDQLKKDLGSNFQVALAQYGYKNEDDLKKTMKIGMMQEKAALKEVKVTDKELKDYYDKYQPDIKARHILVKDEATANDVKKQLDAGAKFEDLAKKYSQDTGTAQKGGDLGWFGTGKMDPAFEKAAFALKLNEISGPVKTSYGYHIIQKTGEKKKESFDAMKKDIEYKVKSSKLTNDIIDKVMQKEMKDAGVKVDDKALKDALNPQTAPSAAPAQ